MPDNARLAASAASFKRVASTEFDKAVKELIALAYKYRDMGDSFMWDNDPELNDEANRICRDLSDAVAERAKAIARDVFEKSLDDYDLDDDWNRDGMIIERLDQEGSHLLELLAIWLAIAFLNDISAGELRVLISRYLSNPFASPLWRGLPLDALKWGRGYARNVLEQIVVIGQNAIVSAYRYAEWQQAMANGAEYYIRRRGSYYDCPECDELCGYPIPIEIPFEWLHSRCMCWPEYHYEPMPL